MDNRKIARELSKIAGMVAGEEPFAQKRLAEAIRILQYLPIYPAFKDKKQGDMAEKKVKAALKMLEEVIEEIPTPVEYLVVGLSRPLAFDNMDDLINALKKYGIRHRGFEQGSNRRPELVGQPKFDSLLGPMYGGPKKVRYETQDVYDRLSK